MEEAESQPAKPNKVGDIPDSDVKGSHTSGKEQADNPGGGLPDYGTVIVAEARGHAPAGQASHQKTHRLAKEKEGTHKRMRMTEVEKLKKDLDDLKK